jgi:hypothetical protein
MFKEGMKFDSEKERFDLIPPIPLMELANLYSRGAVKYGDRNWEEGIKWGRIFAAMMRHAWKWWAGEERDQEDGQHHLASVAWCALTLLEYNRTHPECDDREDHNYPLKETHAEGTFRLEDPCPGQIIRLPEKEKDKIR